MRNKKLFTLLCFTIFFSFGISSTVAIPKCIHLNSNDDEKLKKSYDLAEVLFQKNDFNSCLPVFLQLDKLIPNNSNIQYHIGVCYVNIKGEKNKAIPYLEKAVNDVSLSYKSSYKEITSPIKTIYFLAHAYHLNLKLEEAIKYFGIYKSFLTKRDALMVIDVERQIEMCKNAQQLIKNPILLKSENAFKESSGVKPDYLLYVSSDNASIIYSVKNKSNTGNKEEYFLSKFFKDSKQWDKPVKLEMNANPAIIPENINNGKKKIFISKNVAGDDNIYGSTLLNGKWSDFIKLNPMINSNASETHACASYDGNILYFTSNREGGFGGYDIYKCEKLSSGDWSKPQNLGPKINTPYDEESPYILSDGVTLYFSSKGHNSMGGFDIFTSTVSDEGLWSESENLGYPVNTTDDDIYYFMSKDEKNAFYTTTTNSGDGKPIVYKIVNY